MFLLTLKKNNYMTMQEKNKEIIKTVIAIPFDKWEAYTTELNGVKIYMDSGHSGMGSTIVINSIRFFGKEITEFRYKLDEYLAGKDKDHEIKKTNEIYELLCKKIF